MNPPTSFWPLYRQLMSGRFVDLTHPLETNIPYFDNAKPMQVDEINSYQNGGFQVQFFQFEGQWGTHVDAPSHMVMGKRSIDEIPIQELILPLVVIDIHEKVMHNPDYILLVNDILEWEDEYGRIPAGAFVALRTDWSKRWPDNAAMHNRDASNIPHTPGWSLDALSYLYESCLITATGHETIDPDPGSLARETNWICERYILERNHYQVELLTQLDQCPPTGAIIICAFPKVKGASGFPSRAFAICPTEE